MKSTVKKSVYIPVEGVDNEDNARIVEDKLNKLKGIASNRMEINNHRIVIEPSNGLTVTPDAVKVIRDLGYVVPAVKKTFPVLHMSCASCAASAQSMVKAKSGVIEASVNFATSSLNVEYLPGMVQPEEMKQALLSVGYDLLIETDSDTPDTLEEIRDKKFQTLKKKTIGAILLSLPVVIIGMFFMNIPYANEIMWILSTPVVLLFGRDF